MQYDTVTINNETYRVEFNWNTITDFLEAQGMGLDGLDDIQKLKPSQLTAFIHAAIAEGAAIEEKEFPLTVRQFGALLAPDDIRGFMQIYVAQTATKNAAKKKKITFGRKK